MRKHSAALLCAALLLGLAACGTPDSEPEAVPYAILAAMNVEAKQFVKRMDNARTVKIAGRKYTRGTVGGAEVVLHQCGMGLEKAEAGARALITAFQPEALFVYGTSGALLPEIGLHDVFIAHALCLKGETGEFAIPADDALAALAQELLPHAQRVRLVAEAGFALSASELARISGETGAVAIDMESFAAAKAAREAGVPLLVIRCAANTYKFTSLAAWPKNGPIAADKAAAGIEIVIKKLAERG